MENMTRKEFWIAVATLAATVIGAAFYLGSAMATTTADVAAVRRDIAELQGQVQEMRERSEAQMQELRGYLVDHLDGHAN